MDNSPLALLMRGRTGRPAGTHFVSLVCLLYGCQAVRSLVVVVEDRQVNEISRIKHLVVRSILDVAKQNSTEIVNTVEINDNDHIVNNSNTINIANNVTSLKINGNGTDVNRLKVYECNANADVIVNAIDRGNTVYHVRDVHMNGTVHNVEGIDTVVYATNNNTNHTTDNFNTVNDVDGVNLHGTSNSNNEDNNEDQAGKMNFSVGVSHIGEFFDNNEPMPCSRTSQVYVTGVSVAALAPKNIDALAVLGDALVTGRGLFPYMKELNFRGATFASGGDTNSAGIATIAQIMLTFNTQLKGVSHGVGTADVLPPDQLNVAVDGAETDNMPEQADELIRRVKLMYPPNEIKRRWLLILMAIGTEEMCHRCEEPNIEAIRHALIALRTAVPRALVILIGPAHVGRPDQRQINHFTLRCDCLRDKPFEQVHAIRRMWTAELNGLETDFARRNYTTFGVLVMPTLRVYSRTPDCLFQGDTPLLNRIGHTYAAKWVWNRMMAGWRYNISKVALSQDKYYCPSKFCPFFKTPANRADCMPITLREQTLIDNLFMLPNASNKGQLHGGRALIAGHWLATTAFLMALASASVLIFGAMFYRHGRHATKGRFEESQGV